MAHKVELGGSNPAPFNLSLIYSRTNVTGFGKKELRKVLSKRRTFIFLIVPSLQLFSAVRQSRLLEQAFPDFT